jgi:dihydroxyacid dehydratase/phosphogluconate dehydratase
MSMISCRPKSKPLGRQTMHQRSQAHPAIHHHLAQPFDILRQASDQQYLSQRYQVSRTCSCGTSFTAGNAARDELVHRSSVMARTAARSRCFRASARALCPLHIKLYRREVVSPEADNPGLRFHRQKQITQRPIPTRLRIAIANSVVIVMAAGGGGGWGSGGAQAFADLQEQSCGGR